MGRCTDLDPPRIPLKKGDFEKNLVPPLLRGARGDQILCSLIKNWYKLKIIVLDALPSKKPGFYRY